MNKLFGNFSGFLRAIAWTVFYVFIMWLVLDKLFGFDMFVRVHWLRMMHRGLHGFSGLVFGVMVLAMVPLYVATMVLTVRNKAVPIKVPCPNCFKPVPPKPEPAPEPVVTEKEVLPTLPHGVPQEMREIFLRAQKNYGARQKSVFNKAMFVRDATPPTVQNESENAPVVKNDVVLESGGGAIDMESDLPIPSDFDVATPASDFGVPVFSEIKFDDDDTEVPEENNDLYEFLTGAGMDARVEGNLILVGNNAVASHTDDDFWVADDTDWFASGKQKPSPIAELSDVVQKRGLRPILYLGATNIMNLDTLTSDWQKAGITVVTSREDLLKSIETSAD